MIWLKTIMYALKHEPEVWAAYQLGQRPQAHRTKRKPRLLGVPGRLFAHARHVLGYVKVQSATGTEESIDILIFAQTANQAASLSTTVASLRRERVSFRCIAGQGAASTVDEFADDKSESIKLSLFDAVKVALLTLLRGPIIWWHLRDKDRKLRHWYFDDFLKCHIYLVYFQKVLSSANVRLVVVSNDHNAPQRCLLALARVKSIKTAYMQHASVSHSFPALVFDYSFLDGKVAMLTYNACESHKPVRPMLPGQRHIFLTGQKKPIKRPHSTVPRRVGLAVNSLDDLQDIIHVASIVTEVGIDLRLRWHPRTDLAAIEEIQQACSLMPTIELSDPLIEPVGHFLSQVGAVVAANSSIHLEAAVAGVIPIYFEFSPVSTKDYYGYVRNGLSLEANDVEELIHLLDDVLRGHHQLDALAVQAYSATFGTEWYSREGELVAGIISGVLAGAPPSQFWGYAGTMGQGIDAAASTQK